MAKYLTAGWETVYFIITPRELKTVLEGMHLLEVSSPVPVTYTETPHDEYLEYYQNLYEKRAAGQLVTTADMWEFHSIGVAGTLERHGYGTPFERDGAVYRLHDFEEPCAAIGHFPMCCCGLDGDKPVLSLTTIMPMRGWYDENTVGLELFYPKKIRYPVGEDWTDLESTRDLASYQDFLLLKKRIQAITKPLRVMMLDREIRTRVRVSPMALEDLEKFSFFRNNPVTVKK